MQRFASHVMRQRLLVEGFYSIKVTKSVIKRYFNEITKGLELKKYGEPIIFSPGSLGKKQNQGYDAFIPLIDSGISVYIWSNVKFFSTVIYTCKNFEGKTAIKITKKFFKSAKIHTHSF